MLRVEKNSFESMSNSIYKNLKIIDRYTLINRSKAKNYCISRTSFIELHTQFLTY